MVFEFGSFELKDVFAKQKTEKLSHGIFEERKMKILFLHFSIIFGLRQKVKYEKFYFS